MTFFLKKRLLLFFILLLILPSSKTWCQSLLGVWTGTVNQTSTVYKYTLEIQKNAGDSIFGVSVSSTKDFYCQTKFKGIVLGNKILVQETSIIKTNIKSIESVCLMKINFNRKNETLSGEFSSSSKEIKDCGSGTISLKKIKEKQNIPVKPNDTIKAEAREIETRPAISEIENSKTIRQTPAIELQTKLGTRRSLEQREIDIVKDLFFKEDSAMLKIYDNGMIDGDVITLIINDNIIFDKTKLTSTPLTYLLKSSVNKEFQLVFYAENLGDIPPNTGLITISTNSKSIDVLFSSDLKKSASIKIHLVGQK